MSSTPPAERTADDADHTDDRPIPEFVDWIVGALLVLVGLASVLAGAGAFYAIDRSEIREAVANEDIQSDVLTEAEIVDVVQALATWSAVGLLVTGALLGLVGIAYVVRRRRAHRRAAAGEPVSHYGANALLGAVVAIVLSFIPFSQVLGGFVAGALECHDSDRTVSVGALSGVLSVAPVLALSLFVVGGLVVGLLGIGEGGLALVIVAALLLTLAVLVAFGAGVGAVGGYLGGWLAREEDEERADDERVEAQAGAEPLDGERTEAEQLDDERAGGNRTNDEPTGGDQLDDEPTGGDRLDDERTDRSDDSAADST